MARKEAAAASAAAAEASANQFSYGAKSKREIQLI